MCLQMNWRIQKKLKCGKKKPVLLGDDEKTSEQRTLQCRDESEIIEFTKKETVRRATHARVKVCYLFPAHLIKQRNVP